MTVVNMLEARSCLSRLVELVESGQQSEIARNGRPAARLVPLRDVPAGQRLGAGKRRFVLPESIDNNNPALAQLFGTR